MRIEVQRWVDRVIGRGLCRVLGLFVRDNGDMQTRPEKILVILLSEMGSLILARPMFDRLWKLYPNAAVHVLLFERNQEILEVAGDVSPDRIVTVSDRGLISFTIDSLRAIRKIRAMKMDVVIDCELFARASSVFSAMSGAAIRVGFHPHTQEGLYRGSFINRPVLYNPHVHISEQFVTLAEAIGSRAKPAAKRPLREEPYDIRQMTVSDVERDTARDRFHERFPDVDIDKLVLLAPSGGQLPIRAWDVDRYAEVADTLCKEGYSIGIIGLPEDQNLAARILTRCQSDRCVDLTSYTKGIRDLMLVFQFASLLIANDGGPGHFASLTPLPAIVLFGPETPQLYGSLSPRARNLFAGISCSPCLTAYNHRNSPCDGDNLCLKLITTEQVITAAHEALGKASKPKWR